jgi:hypothetical protein
MGGAGVAAPALIWSLIRPVTFFFGGIATSVRVVGRRRGR